MAIKGAKYHCIPQQAIIYFAVDIDALDTEITNNILPYFRAISETMTLYRVGVYGTRNVCTRVMEAGYAETCFVSDMSTGYSGNMGFKMPTDWNLDQFSEVSITNTEGTWKIDKVAYSQKFPVVEQLGPRYLYKGDVTFTGSNIGTAHQFGGSKLKLYVSATDENGNSIEDVSVLVTMKAQEPITGLLDINMSVLAEANGNTYTFEDTVVSPPYPNNYMRISDENHYYAEYKVYKNSVEDNSQRVKVHIEIETED